MFSPLFVLLFAACIFAQSVDRTVESIDKRYAEIAEKVRLCETDEDQGQFGELVINELIINSRRHQWRAVGIYGQTFKFFYKGGESEAHLYPDQLVFVKTERRSSNRVYHEEFLYSDAGVLLLYFQKAENDEQTPADRRVYFNGARPVRILEDGKRRDKLNSKDLEVSRDAAAMSAKISGIFKSSIRL